MSRRHWIAALAIVTATALILLALGRSPICACGEIRLWTGAVHSADNSQHLSDWYTPSHIIHGFIFHGLAWLWARDKPAGYRFCLAVLTESLWEILENSPLIINRYREATAAFGYSGDAIVNSVADVGWMALGFWAARRLGLWPTVAIALAFELLTLWTIRDNLTLNVLMLLWPIEGVREWQAGL